MLYPIAHPFVAVSPEWTRLHYAELDLLIERRQPAIWKLAR